RRAKYKISHNLLTLNNIVIFVAGAIAISWAWGSVMAMQKNYTLQQELDMKKRDRLVAEIQYETLEYEQKYLQSREYQEIAARDKLGLVKPGEQVLLLSEDNPGVSSDDQSNSTSVDAAKESNFRQWINFLLGGNANREK
ncbi:hypothetical protein KBE46_02130, partial [Candidatus Saccharibacteria bacterium]|nr:hypothetical protein [Candidatus Saccharibacteria bacterium]